jgi:hypothetical protein
LTDGFLNLLAMVNEDDDADCTKRSSSQSQLCSCRHCESWKWRWRGTCNSDLQVCGKERVPVAYRRARLGPTTWRSPSTSTCSQQPLNLWSCRHIIHISPWYVSLRNSRFGRQGHMLTSAPVCTKLGWNPNAARRRLNPRTSVNNPTYPYP